MKRWLLDNLLSNGTLILDYPLADLGSVVITINYRHAPEHTYPTATDDSLTGYRWVLANAASLGVDASSIVLGGLSA